MIEQLLKLYKFKRIKFFGYILRKLYKSSRIIINIYSNIFIYKLINKNASNKLFIYDLRNNPPSFGDVIYFYHKFIFSDYKNKKIIFLINKSIPYLGDLRFNKVFNKSNYQLRINQLYEVGKLLNINQNSIHLMDRNEFKNFLSVNNCHLIYPNYYNFFIGSFLSNNYVTSKDFINLKFLKTIKISEKYKFLRKDFFNIVIHIRHSNDNREVERNSNLAIWNKVLSEFKNHKRIKFFIICDEQEYKYLKNKILKYKNVHFTKDLNFSIKDDFSIVYYSDLYIGSNSGPSTIRFLSKKPYIICGLDLHDRSRYASTNFFINIDSHTQKFIFAKNNQIISKNWDFDLIKNFIYEFINDT